MAEPVNDPDWYGGPDEEQLQIWAAEDTRKALLEAVKRGHTIATVFPDFFEKPTKYSELNSVTQRNYWYTGTGR